MEQLPLGAILNSVRNKIERYIWAEMNNNQIPASLMDGILDGVQSNIRKAVAEEYALTMLRMQEESIRQEEKAEKEEKNG